MQHFIVTGSLGRIGSSLVERLLRDGHHVLGVDRHSRPGAVEVVKSAPTGAIVIHCAGNPDEDASWAELHTTNVLLAAQVLDAAVVNQARAIILLSSEWVTMDPGRPYSRSKTAVEALAKAYAGQSPTQVIVDRVGSFDGLERAEAGERFAAIHVSPEAFYQRVMALLGEKL